MPPQSIQIRFWALRLQIVRRRKTRVRFSAGERLWKASQDRLQPPVYHRFIPPKIINRDASLALLAIPTPTNGQTLLTHPRSHAFRCNGNCFGKKITTKKPLARFELLDFALEINVDIECQYSGRRYTITVIHASDTFFITHTYNINSTYYYETVLKRKKTTKKPLARFELLDFAL